MTKHTKRDRIWDVALRLSADGKFELSQVLATGGLDERSERTARDVLLTMTDLGHLDRAKSGPNGGSLWYDGDTYPREGRGRIPWSDRDRELRETQHSARSVRHYADMIYGSYENAPNPC